MPCIDVVLSLRRNDRSEFASRKLLLLGEVEPPSRKLLLLLEDAAPSRMLFLGDAAPEESISIVR